MTETTVLNRKSLRAPPRIDPAKLSQALQDLFAGWYVSLKENFKGLSATGDIVPGLFPIRPTGVSVQPIIAAANVFWRRSTPGSARR